MMNHSNYHELTKDNYHQHHFYHNCILHKFVVRQRFHKASTSINNSGKITKFSKVINRKSSNFELELQ